MQHEIRMQAKNLQVCIDYPVLGTQNYVFLHYKHLSIDGLEKIAGQHLGESENDALSLDKIQSTSQYMQYYL